MSCIKTCPETCSENCSVTCPEACLKTSLETSSINCQENCSEICPKPCSFTFPKTCPESCETCGETCAISCPETCSETRSKPCNLSCPETCTKSCSFTCPDTCERTCSETCPGTCFKSHSKPCCFFCPEACTKQSSFTCPETCEKTCSETCSIIYPEVCSHICFEPCSFTFPETCSGFCFNTCSENCCESCSFTFPKTCPESSSITCPETSSDICSKPCSFTFPKICPENCLNNCSETCSQTCPETCSFTFSEPCPETYGKTISETCSTTEIYPKPCSFTSPETCSETCLKTYSETCTKSCPENSESCPNPCSLSNPSLSKFSNTCSKTSQSITIPSRCGTGAPKAHSVYGCGFGGRTRISSCSYHLDTCSPPYKTDNGYSCGGYGERFSTRIVGGGCYGRDYDCLQKTTMQNLNDRLASYLDKVHFLEAANANLERQIREYYEKKGPICQKDYSCYFKTIDCLNEKIRDATISNGKILLRIDNSKLAGDDFRIKYENELSLRQCVKADIDNLRCIFNKTCLAKADLDMQICTLQEELMYLKKSHKEVVAALLCQLSKTRVCVEVDAAPQQDLKKVLDDIRCHYDNIIDKYCREQQGWFQEKMADVCKDAAISTECLETSMSQISELRRTLQSLEIELQSQICMKGALECSLLETKARYSAMLAGYQKHINTHEAELCQVRVGIEQQGRDYAALLDIKSHLEQEIATYRCLLENQCVKT